MSKYQELIEFVDIKNCINITANFDAGLSNMDMQ